MSDIEAELSDKSRLFQITKTVFAGLVMAGFLVMLVLGTDLRKLVFADASDEASASNSDFLRARALYDAKEWDQAEPLYRQVLEETPYISPTFLYEHGRCLQQMQSYEQSLIAYGRAEDFLEVRRRTQFNIAQVYAVIGKTQEAIDSLAKAIRKNYTTNAGIEMVPEFQSLLADERFASLAKQERDIKRQVQAMQRRSNGRGKQSRRRR